MRNTRKKVDRNPTSRRTPARESDGKYRLLHLPSREKIILFICLTHTLFYPVIFRQRLFCPANLIAFLLYRHTIAQKNYFFSMPGDRRRRVFKKLAQQNERTFSKNSLRVEKLL
jgi:hypothetical protein